MHRMWIWMMLRTLWMWIEQWIVLYRSLYEKQVLS
jgi:hypothetical protein